MNTPRFIAEPFFNPPNEALRFLPEGPRALRNYPSDGGDSRKLGWVAIQHATNEKQGSINVLDLASLKNKSIPVPGRPGFFAETTEPGIVLVGLERRLVYCNLVTGDVKETGIVVTDDERVIINEGLAIEEGVFLGTKHLKFNQPLAALYFYDNNSRQVRTLIPGQTCSNGKFFRRNTKGATLIDIDSIPKTITCYRFDHGFKHLLSQSQIATAIPRTAVPDGLRPAPDGDSVVVAFYNHGMVADGVARQIRLADGKIVCEWQTPGSPRVTCPEFVVMDGKVKVIFTTAVEGMEEATRRSAPNAGMLFIADTPFKSLPESPPLLAL